MDFNGDGKHDWQDSAIEYSLFRLANGEDDEADPGGCALPIAKIILCVVGLLCLYALFTGAFEVILTLIGLGIVVALLARWIFG